LGELPPPFSVVRDTERGTRRQQRQVGGFHLLNRNLINYLILENKVVIRVYDGAGNVIETHEHAGGFRGDEVFARITSLFPLKRVSHNSALIRGNPR
jgi:hypothetical protein